MTGKSVNHPGRCRDVRLPGILCALVLLWAGCGWGPASADAADADDEAGVAVVFVDGADGAAGAADVEASVSRALDVVGAGAARACWGEEGAGAVSPPSGRRSSPRRRVTLCRSNR
jgi:hypothetical protein